MEEERLVGVRNAWGELLKRHLTDFRLEVDKEVQAKKTAVEEVLDLGSKFNEPRLNQKVVEENGEEKPVFECSESGGNLSLKCTICSVTTTGIKTMVSHLAGRKHREKIEGLRVVEGAGVADPMQAAAALVPERGLLSRLLPLHQGAPLLGIDFVTEVLVGRSEPDYHCLLCSTAVTVREVVVHLSTASHQLAFLAQAKPELYLQFAAHSSNSPETWDKATLNSLDSVVEGLEVVWKEPKVVASPLVFEATKEEIFAEMEASNRD